MPAKGSEAAAVSWDSFGKSPESYWSFPQGLPRQSPPLLCQAEARVPSPLQRGSDGELWFRLSWGRGEAVGKNSLGTLASTFKASAQDPGDRAVSTTVGT